MRFSTIAVLAALAAAPCFAQDAPDEGKPRPVPGRPARPSAGRPGMPPWAPMGNPADPKFQEEMRRGREKMLEDLKQSNPEAYERMKKAEARNTEIRDILEKHRAGDLSEGEARKRLLPLTKDEMKPWLERLDECVQRMEKRLEFAKKVQKDPELLERRQVDALRGKGEEAGEEPGMNMMERPCLPPPPYAGRGSGRMPPGFPGMPMAPDFKKTPPPAPESK